MKKHITPTSRKTAPLMLPPGGLRYLSRAEFHEGLDALRDKIDARFLTLCEKIETLSNSLPARLNQTEASIARLDERTKL